MLPREVILLVTALSASSGERDDDGPRLTPALLSELYYQHRPTSSGMGPTNLYNPRTRTSYLADQLAARLGGWANSQDIINMILRSDDDGLSSSQLFGIAMAYNRAQQQSQQTPTFNNNNNMFGSWLSSPLSGWWGMMDD
jgi:hypothetical protein